MLATTPLPVVSERLGRIVWHQRVEGFSTLLQRAARDIEQRMVRIQQSAQTLVLLRANTIQCAVSALPELALLEALLQELDLTTQETATMTTSMNSQELGNLCTKWAELCTQFNRLSLIYCAAAGNLVSQINSFHTRLDGQRRAIDHTICSQEVQRNTARSFEYLVNPKATCFLCLKTNLKFVVRFERWCTAVEASPLLHCSSHQCGCDYRDPAGLICLDCVIKQLYHGAGDGTRSYATCPRCKAHVCIHDIRLMRLKERTSPRLLLRSCK